MYEFKRIISSIILTNLLVVSAPSLAMTVEFEYPNWYGGQDGVPVVEQVGLEWLRWDITNGMSIDTAINTFEQDGWRLASNIEMADLLNFWDFGTGFGTVSTPGNGSPTPFTGNENSTESNWDPATHQGLGRFEDMFGLTSYFCDKEDEFNYEYYGCQSHASAFFGADDDGDGLYNLVDLHYIGWPYNSYSTVSMFADEFESSDVNDTIGWSWDSTSNGVALVRDISVTPVPIPAPLVLFASGLFGLGLLRRFALVNR